MPSALYSLEETDELHLFQESWNTDWENLGTPYSICFAYISLNIGTSEVSHQKEYL